MWWGGYHWWWPGPVLMGVGMLVCMAVMALMMGHGRGMGGMGRFWGLSRPGRHQTGTSGQILDERLARGEIDVEEYRRIQQTLARSNSPAGSEEQVGSPL